MLKTKPISANPPATLHIHPLPPRYENGSVILSANWLLPTNETQLIWFAVSEKQSVTDLADPFLLAALFLGLQNGWHLHVHGKVSALLKYNLQEFQAIWQAKAPHLYRAVPISADEWVHKTASAKACISTYSGGVDSSFTAFSHAPDRNTSYPLQAGLMVHGFDIPLEDPVFSAVLKRARESLASLGMECIAMRTNFREVNHTDWYHAHGSALAACLHVVSPRFGIALIPSSYAYHENADLCGSTPLSDPLLSSESLRIVHDGASFTRRDKLATLSNWAAGLAALRVCWQGQERDRNCCRCEKCIRNMINFRLLGIEIPSSFPEPLNTEVISNLLFGRAQINIWRVLISAADKSGNFTPDILQAMRHVTKKMQRREWRQARKRGIQYAWKRFFAR